jgi:hypothetical protein
LWSCDGIMEHDKLVQNIVTGMYDSIKGNR